MPVHPDDVEKTAIITPFGTYVFFFSTFGLRNSGATFQRLMDSIFCDVPFCVVFVDDILIFSKSCEDHVVHLRVVLQLLRDNGLIVRPDKCVFGAEAVDFLGHRVSAAGVSPLASKVAAVREFPRPESIKSLQVFLGMVNWYHRRIPHAGDILYTAIVYVLCYHPRSLRGTTNVSWLSIMPRTLWLMLLRSLSLFLVFLLF